MKGMTLMSRTLSAPRWGLSAALAGALALALMALAAVGLSSQANAAFSTAKCNGPSITGEGGSFAKDAHGVYNFNFKNSYCPGTSANVTYAPNGSGAGVKSVTLRTLAPRFGQTDDPPTAAQVNLMNAGATVDPGAGKAVTVADTDPSNDGKIHVVPSAVGAVVALVNFPVNCDPTLLTPAHRTDTVPTTDDALLRVRFAKSEFEQIWAQGASGGPSAVPYLHWDDVLTELNTDADCDVAITRVVRFDQSGTTFTFKDYLDAINSARGWSTTYSTTDATNLTRIWPGASFGPRSDCSGTEGPGGGATEATDNLTSACGTGNGNLIDKLIATEGSVGYADLATARNKGLALNPAGAPGPTTPYWTQVQNGSGTFTEPSADVNGFRTDGTKGANCLQATFSGLPTTPADKTFGDWSQTSGVDSAQGYGICTLTYGLVFDDNAAVWGNKPAEEAAARTVKDYWEAVLTDSVQGQLFAADYAPLPAGILAISRTGIGAVDWNKTANGGGGGGGGNTPPANNGGGGGNPAPVKPSNLFSLPRKSISSKTGGATISVKLPGAGQLELVGTAKSGKKTIKVGRVVLTANKAGSFDLALKPSAAAKKVLREKGSLKVALELTFTPDGGEANTDTSSVTLKLKQQKK